MNLEKIYAVGKLNFNIDEIIKRGERQLFKTANQKHPNGTSFRNSNVTWIKDWPELEHHVVNRIKPVNEKFWKFNLIKFEPFQYSIYNEGDYYDWHSDQHPKQYADGMVRKLTFSLALTDDYEGGEFECAVLSGAKKDKPDVKVFNVNEIENFSKGTMVVFPSFLWHRVKPITKGVRKALQGWAVGKNFV
jgi:PKHD-type hydroxylase|tara:strand:+ start:121 stop:690 length:570 start_codon:yes stop_codon:yes gene_type:complete